jgi:hypothetical protein
VAACARLEALCGESELACADACVDGRTAAAVTTCAADAAGCDEARACGPPFDGASPE